MTNPDHTKLLTLSNIPEGLASHKRVLDVSSKNIYRIVNHTSITFRGNVMDVRDVRGCQDLLPKESV